MMPKSLLHQTLAKLISETDRTYLFFSFSITQQMLFYRILKTLSSTVVFLQQQKTPNLVDFGVCIYFDNVANLYTNLRRWRP